MEYIVYQIDSFTKEKFKGNPAGVVINADGLNDTQMQFIARELNNSETAFIFSPNGNDHDIIIRYFTPRIEVPTCGHATIAALYAKAIKEKLNSWTLRVKTKIGVLPCEIVEKCGEYQMYMTQGKFEQGSDFVEKDRDLLLNALGLKVDDLNLQFPILIASTGHSKVMVGINSRSKLNSLSPNYSALAEFSKNIECNGYFVYTFDSDQKDILTYGRMFAPAIGVNEDPVTGNAYGPLGGYLIQNGIFKPNSNTFSFKGRQGEAINRLGEISVDVRLSGSLPEVIRIGGNAVLVFKTIIDL